MSPQRRLEGLPQWNVRRSCILIECTCQQTLPKMWDPPEPSLHPPNPMLDLLKPHIIPRLASSQCETTAPSGYYSVRFGIV
jgi:hypothetical protein